MNIRKAGTQAPPKMLIYGAPGAGKTRFSGGADGALVIDMEDGTASIDCDRTDKLESWPDALAAMQSVVADNVPNQVIVIDSLDWLLRLIEEEVTGSKVDVKANLYGCHGGFGRGGKIMMNYIRQGLIPALNAITRSGRVLIMTAHVTKTDVLDGDGQPTKKVAPDILVSWMPVFAQWVDIIGYVRKIGDTDKRVLGLTETGFYAAKNRYDLAGEMPIPKEPASKGYEMLMGAIRANMDKRMNKE